MIHFEMDREQIFWALSQFGWLELASSEEIQKKPSQYYAYEG